MYIMAETRKFKCVYFITEKYSFHHSVVIIHDLYNLISGSLTSYYFRVQADVTEWQQERGASIPDFVNFLCSQIIGKQSGSDWFR